jgi:plastocyanin
MRPLVRPRSVLGLLALLPVLSCGGSGGDGVVEDGLLPGGDPPPHDVTIVVNAEDAGPNAFSPSSIVISLASQDTVTWYNADIGYGSGEEHRLESNDGDTFRSGDLEAGETFRATFTAPGVYAYHCEKHPGMTGTITVEP